MALPGEAKEGESAAAQTENLKLADLKLKAPGSDAGPWIMAVPVVNTDHVPQNDRNILAAELRTATGMGRFNGCPVMAEIYPHDPIHLGFLLSLDDMTEWEDSPEPYSPAFLSLLKAIRDMGFRYLRLDESGTRFDDIDTYSCE